MFSIFYFILYFNAQLLGFSMEEMRCFCHVLTWKIKSKASVHWIMRDWLFTSLSSEMSNFSYYENDLQQHRAWKQIIIQEHETELTCTGACHENSCKEKKKKSNFCLSTKQEERFVLCLKWFREAAVYSRSPLKHTACQKGAIQRLTKCNQPPGYRHFSFHTSQVWADRSFFIIIRHLKPDESELLVKQHIGNHTKHQQ